VRPSPLERLAPLAGVGFVVVLLSVFFVFGNNEPSATDSTQTVVNYWHAHHSREMAGGLVGILAVILLVWFAGSVRERLAAAEGGQGRLASISFAGFILFAVGGTIFSGLEFALGDVATKVPDGVVQTLSVMESDLFAPVAAGAILALFATGIASLRYGVLPAWLAWLGFVIGVVTFTPAGFFGFLAFLVWVLITSVMLYTSQDQEAAAG
jgi:hypothetical protein